MRTLFRDEVWVEYGQLYVDSRDDPDEGGAADLDTCFAGQRGGLCGAAIPGHLWLVTGLHTGLVPLTVEVHATVPALPRARWEDIHEVSFRTASDTTALVTWDGDVFDLGLPAGGYRVRYLCRGMDAAHRNGSRDEEDGQELDAYLLQFWPAPPAPDEVVRETSESAAYWHGCARELPPPPTPEERAEAARVAREQEEREARAQHEEAERAAWGGRSPSERLRDVGGNVAGMVSCDVALVHALGDASPDTQRAVARWAAHRACEGAGLDAVDWIARGLDELDRGVPFSPPLDEAEASWARLFADPLVPDTSVDVPEGPAGARRQAMAFPALAAAAGPDPLRAALDALHAAGISYGPDCAGLFARARAEFPEVAAITTTGPGQGIKLALCHRTTFVSEADRRQAERANLRAARERRTERAGANGAGGEGDVPGEGGEGHAPGEGPAPRDGDAAREGAETAWLLGVTRRYRPGS